MTNAQLIALYKSIQVSSDLVLAQIAGRNMDWQHLAEYGLNAQATLAYRNKHKCSLKEAHEAITAFRTNQIISARCERDEGSK
jgi:hypothetical protein